jgi:hypothetical protein
MGPQPPPALQFFAQTVIGTMPTESPQQISPSAQSAASSHVTAAPPLAQPAPNVGMHTVASESPETQHALVSCDPT